MNLIQLASLLASAALVTSLSACQGAGASGTQNQPLPVALSQPESDPSPPKETSRSPCGSLSDGFQCLAVKYVSYSDSQSGQLLKEEEAQQNLRELYQPKARDLRPEFFSNRKSRALDHSLCVFSGRQSAGRRHRKLESQWFVRIHRSQRVGDTARHLSLRHCDGAGRRHFW